MRKLVYLFIFSLLFNLNAVATGEPSTYFNIFVPPNNDAIHRDVALIVTAIYDSTFIDIVDDDMDGDSDDSYSGYLMAGQSYVLYIKDNGINDDARYASGGVLKSDGDYFTITSNKLVFASQSTNSDWQFDYAPSVNKSSIGNRFIIYSPNTSFSNRDLNVFAYEDQTTVTIKRISTSSHTQTGKNTVNIYQDEVVLQQTMNIGQDLIHHFTGGRDIMESGHTYLIESNKAVSVQYGALWKNSRDGGAYVPSSNGSSSGELFYFTVPYQANLEQEIRIVSWDESNNVKLYRYASGAWIQMKNWSLASTKTADWVGRTENETFSTVFKVECTSGKKISVFTANWLETGNPGTSDIATMVSSKAGTTSGNEFICYMAPPGNEQNVTDPFTNQKFGGAYTHLYLFAKDSATITVKDVFTNGQDFNRTFTIAAGRYADCALSLQEWQNIYNGNGSASGGPERPYLHVQSDGNIAVMNTNFNDNWMMYFGSSLQQSFKQNSKSSQSRGIPGDTITVISHIELASSDPVTSVNGQVTVGSGAIPHSSVFVDSTTNTIINGSIQTVEDGSLITFDSLPDLENNGNYSINTEIVLLSAENDGSELGENAVVTVESILTGTVNGTLQQSTTSQGISNSVSNSSNLIFSKVLAGDMVNTPTDSWNSSWVDIDADGDQDLFVTTRNKSQLNILYRNDGNGGFVKLDQAGFLSKATQAMSAAWADVDNDGDMDALIVNNNYDPLQLYRNNGNNSFSKVNHSGFSKNPGYYHGAAWADYNQDGYLDLIVANYFPTRFHELYANKGNGTFERQSQSLVSQTSGQTVAPTWIDYNSDGLPDLFFPNNGGENNFLFRNESGRFIKTENEITTGGGNSVAACWGDVDNDGDFDLFVANTSGQKDFFYYNNGDGTFTRDSMLNISNHGTNTHGCSWIDVDNDMDLDLYLTDDQGAKQLYIQNSDGSFTNKMDEQLVANYGTSYGQAISDFNRDGYLDIFVSTHSNQHNFLWENNGSDQHFINIICKGTVSNTNAVGSKVSLKAGGIWQHKWINRQNGYGSENSLEQHFGLADQTVIDSLVIAWPSGFRQIETNLVADRFIVINEEASTLVSGTIYADLNENCMLDSNENGIAHQQVIVQPGNVNIQTNNKGEYEFRAAPGNYTISHQSTENWSSVCTPLPVLANQNLTPIADQNIGIKAEQYVADVSVSYGSTLWRRGFTNEAFLKIENKGTSTAYQLSASLTLPTELKLISSSVVTQKIGHNKFSWQIDSMAAGEVFIINLEDSVLLTASVGQELQVTAEIEPVTGETTLANNNQVFKELVVGAVDPNDLLAWPKPIAGSPYTFVSALDTITYKVRFQNVGTYEAAHVFIRSKLPEHLDVANLNFISESHDGSYSIQNHEIVWTFRNINLPDSSTDEKGSHGYVMYSIVVDQNKTNGIEYTGEASITFDYENSMTTNRVVHKVINLVQNEDELYIWPNPASRNTLVWTSATFDEEGAPPLLKSYIIYSTSGKEIHRADVSGRRILLTPSKDLKPGTYLIIVKDENKKSYKGILIVN